MHAYQIKVKFKDEMPPEEKRLRVSFEIFGYLLLNDECQ